jgi:hypothetical protein
MLGDLFFAILSYSMSVRKIIFRAEQSTIERAREVARSEGKTSEDAFREWLDWYASRNVTREEIEALYRSLKQVDAGRKFSRDEMNER